MSTLGTPQIKRQNTSKAHHTSREFAQRHVVALKEKTGKDNHRKDAELIENSGSRTLAIRQSEIEKRIMQGGVQKGKQQNVPRISRRSQMKPAPGELRHEQDDDARQTKPNAGKHHFATRHPLRDAKLGKARFDERICPAPCHGGCNRK